MNKTIAAVCVGLILAAAGLASARHVPAAPAAHSKINSGWGLPVTWDEIEISTPDGAF